MGMSTYTVHHLTHGLDTVAHAHARVEGLAADLVADDAVRGVVVIPTCNRLEVILDAADCPHLDLKVTGRLDVADATKRSGTEAIGHIVRVACGLDSLVVGEREVSGQVRRALTVAHNTCTASPVLTRVLQGALTTSRRVAQLTGLASQGRSVVACGLDLADPDLAGKRVLLVGTGAYAGATVAALRARGVFDISVYSTSGRAELFARGHDLAAVPADGLVDALAGADLTVTCRGLGSPVLRLVDLRAARAARTGDLTVLDLALRRDLEAGAEEEPGVRVVTMADVRAAVPDVASTQLERAEALVAEGIADIENDLRTRAAVPAVKAVRAFITEALNDEIDRLPAGPSLRRDDAIRALRRLAGRLAHTPTIRAREAAEGGRTQEFVDALEQVMGLVVDHPLTTMPGRDDGWDTATCPATGLRLDDLAPVPAATQEAS